MDEIKCRLQKPPVLHLPDGKGRFHLYSDTSKHSMGSALYQIQNGKPKLIAYASKTLPEVAKNYSITELEMCGLAINIKSFAHILKRVDFDAIVDHLALVHILKSKTEPVTTRIKRLLEVLSAYSFNLYYMKGKEMILSNFLSRQRTDNSNQCEIIPISFDMQAILKDRYYNVGNDSRYLIQMQSQAKAGGIKLPEVHSVDKDVDPSVKPERHILKSPNLTTQPNHQNRPRLGQGREGLRRKMKDPYTSSNTSAIQRCKSNKRTDITKAIERHTTTFN